MQKIKRMIKKIGAISIGGVLLGSTIMSGAFAATLGDYPAPFVDPPVGSYGIETIYFSEVVKTDKSISPVHVPPVLQISVWVVVIDAGIVPLLSIAYW